MDRSPLPLNTAVPASSAARETLPPRHGVLARASRGSRVARLAIALATCGVAASLGWILVTGTLNREPEAPGVAAPPCDASSCRAHFAPASRELPREWRWAGRKVELDSMYRR